MPLLCFFNGDCINIFNEAIRHSRWDFFALLNSTERGFPTPVRQSPTIIVTVLYQAIRGSTQQLIYRLMRPAYADTLAPRPPEVKEKLSLVQLVLHMDTSWHLSRPLLHSTLFNIPHALYPSFILCTTALSHPPSAATCDPRFQVAPSRAALRGKAKLRPGSPRPRAAVIVKGICHHQPSHGPAVQH